MFAFIKTLICLHNWKKYYAEMSVLGFDIYHCEKCDKQKLRARL